MSLIGIYDILALAFSSIFTYQSYSTDSNAIYFNNCVLSRNLIDNERRHFPMGTYIERIAIPLTMIFEKFNGDEIARIN